MSPLAAVTEHSPVTTTTTTADAKKTLFASPPASVESARTATTHTACWPMAHHDHDDGTLALPPPRRSFRLMAEEEVSGADGDLALCWGAWLEEDVLGEDDPTTAHAPLVAGDLPPLLPAVRPPPVTTGTDEVEAGGAGGLPCLPALRTATPRALPPPRAAAACALSISAPGLDGPVPATRAAAAAVAAAGGGARSPRPATAASARATLKPLLLRPGAATDAAAAAAARQQAGAAKPARRPAVPILGVIPRASARLTGGGGGAARLLHLAPSTETATSGTPEGGDCHQAQSGEGGAGTARAVAEPPSPRRRGRKRRLDPVLVAADGGGVVAVSPAEYRRLRRRVTNRLSARRMRAKRAEERAAVGEAAASAQTEVDVLRARAEAAEAAAVAWRARCEALEEQGMKLR